MKDSGRKLQPENRIHLFDPMGLINDKYGVRIRRATRSSDGFTGTNVGGGGSLRFAEEAKAESDSDGSSSPRLWKSTSPPTSPKSVGCSPPRQLQPQHSPSPSPSPSPHSQPMSPNSRTQAIARGQRELMEMIKDIPESCYELSLRDIVEQKLPPSPAVDPQQQDAEKKFSQQVPEPPMEKQGKQKQERKKSSKKVAKSESKKKMVKSASFDNSGFLLKTSMFPVPFRLRKKRSLKPTASFRVNPNPNPNPKPPLAPPTSKSSAEKDWWGRKSRLSSESESGGLTNSNSESARSSGSSSRSSSISSRHRHSNRFLPSCCSFFNDKRIKPKKYITT